MVSSVGSNYSAVSAYTTRARPDPAQLASKLFSKLDTKGQGYLQESDLASAFSQVYSSSSSSSSTTVTDASSSSQASSDASQLFSALDSDSNGQVTESEFSSGLQKLAEALDSQAFSSRMQGAGGMPPPPPQGHDGGEQDDSGFTKDQLTSQLQDIGSTDSKRSSLISEVVNNFDKADADGDGKVTRQEAMAYAQSQGSTSGTSTSDSSSSTTSSTSAANRSDAALMHRLMELVRTYGANSATPDGTSSASSITVSA